MQRIRSSGTTPERKVIQELKRQKVYFAANVLSIYGKPDIVFRRKKTLVFIDSDFWHGNPKRCIMPKSNIEYWQEKILRNKRRDKEVSRKLRLEGWRVIRLWEHQINKNVQKCINRIIRALETSA